MGEVSCSLRQALNFISSVARFGAKTFENLSGVFLGILSREVRRNLVSDINLFTAVKPVSCFTFNPQMGGKM
jgi:hypothetical protein